MTKAGRLSTSGPLDESDVECAITAEGAAEPSAAIEAQSPEYAEEARATVDFTADDLERELENGGPSLEEQVVHAEDAIVEILDDERDVTDADLTGEFADELEWRMAEAGRRTTARGTAGEGDRHVGNRAG